MESIATIGIVKVDVNVFLQHKLDHIQLVFARGDQQGVAGEVVLSINVCIGILDEVVDKHVVGAG